MKTILLAAFFLVTATLRAQNLPSGVHSWAAAPVKKTATGESRQMVRGTTTDLTQFSVHTSLLLPGKTNHPPVAHDDMDELVVVKEGRLTLLVNDTPHTIGPGGLALIIAGDRQSFRNDGTGPATYYILSYTSRNKVDRARGQQGGGSYVRDWKDFTVKQTDKGESRPVFDRPSPMFERFDIHATNLNPGVASHDPHHHRAEEVILLLKGTVLMQIGNTFHPATAGDFVFLASEDLHALRNTGPTPCSYFAIQWHNKKED